MSGIQVCANEVPFQLGDKNTCENTWTTFGNIHFENHRVNCNPTWHHASLNEVNAILNNWRTILFFLGIWRFFCLYNNKCACLIICLLVCCRKCFSGEQNGKFHQWRWTINLICISIIFNRLTEHLSFIYISEVW